MSEKVFKNASCATVETGYAKIPEKEGVVLHLKRNSRKEGGENCEQTSSEPIFAIVGIYSGWGTACVQW